MNTRIRFFVGPLSLALLISPASALEYHYTVDLYPNHFYTSTSPNRALDIDSADNSGGASITIPSDSMSADADNTTPREGSPVIPVGSYIDPWGGCCGTADQYR